MEVMSLRWWEEWQMISTMGIKGAEDGEADPEPDSSNVWAKDQRAKEYRREVGTDVLQWVGIDSCDGNGALPLVVHLVEVLVEQPVVEQPGGTHQAQGFWFLDSMKVI